jgi:hypothetical protein
MLNAAIVPEVISKSLMLLPDHAAASTIYGVCMPQGMERIENLRKAIREFLYGMTGMEFAEHALEMRSSVENLFLLAIVGDMIGIPILPPYYSLRVLPYVVPQIETWKRRVLRERSFTEDHDYHLDGL